jgi:predicted ATPase
MGRATTDLLERSAQMAELHEELRRAAAGEGSIVFLGGEAGIGKSSLVRRFAAEADRAARVLVGACDPLSTPRPLGPLLDVADGLGGEVVQLLLADAPATLVFRAVLAALGDGTKPTVLVIEDTHWADEASLDLVRFLGRRIAAVRTLLVVTYRDDEVGATHPFRTVMGDLATGTDVRRMTLLPLSEHAVQRLAASYVAGRHLDPAALHRQTGGNPFFITEVLATGTGGVPATVRDAILARVSRLSPAARAVLETAAVVGPRIEPQLLTEIAELGESLAAAVDECLTRGLLRAEGETVTFKHDLGREAVLGEIPPVRRVALHARALAALRSLPPQIQDPARLAHHAEASGDRQAVLAHAPAAARRAAALGAHREAASQYARALRCADMLPPGERASLLEASAYEHYLTGAVAAAIAGWREAIELRRPLGDRMREGENLRHLARALWIVGRRDEADTAAREAIAVLKALPAGSELAMAYSALAQLCMLDESLPMAIEWGRQGISLAEQLGDTETLTHALNNVGFSRLLAGDEGGREELERSLRLAIDHGFVEHAARAYMNLVAAHVRHYQLDLAEQQLAEGLAFCTEHEFDVYEVSLLSFRALALVHRGRWDEAADVASSILSRPPETIETTALPNALLVLGRLRARRGESAAMAPLDEALAIAERTRESGRIGAIRAARAEAAWLAGDRKGALAEARSGLDLAMRNAEPWLQGELAVWLRRVGGTEIVLPHLSAVPEPFAIELAGNWPAAAAAWEALGCPFETALVLMAACGAVDVRAGRRGAWVPL